MGINWQTVPSTVIHPAFCDDAEEPLYLRIWELIATSYPEGHTSFPHPATIPANLAEWLLGWESGELVACAGGKHTRHGTKWTVMAGDGRIRTSLALIRKLVEVLRQPGNYAEVSESIQKATQMPILLPMEVIEVLGDVDLFSWGSGSLCGYYHRMIDGFPRQKCMIGSPVK